LNILQIDSVLLSYRCQRFSLSDKTIVFITATWALGNLSTWLHMPSLVGEIMSGFLLGPPLADFCPFPEAMVLIGSFGLIGLILESGIDLDVGQLKETGKRAILMAFTGTALPLLVGMGLGRAAGQELQSSIAIGATFSPSSLGVSANVLSAGEVLNTPTGQMIVASSVVDDVLGLIMLSILDVFVRENTTAFDYCIPFISSFGYLIVLGYSGITWMPYIIEHKIMARFPEGYRELVAFCLMFLLLLVYLPLLNYSRASYLTGTFLAGLTFSQINSVHAAFAQHGRGILDWLLRIFFAATIGFQVPITRFQDGYVLKWGAKFLVPILAKMPLGLYVPRSNCKTLPEDFPYDPYWRDVWITSLALVCRGEFNFIIASFALSEGLVNPDIYSAIVFSVLCASIFGPLILARVIAYYNAKSQAYLSGSHPIERDGDTSDGFRPLYLAIQARTPIHWGLQDSFKKALDDAGLIIIDHRSWHTLGLNAIDITELFVQDTRVKVRVCACFETRKAAAAAAANSGESVAILLPIQKGQVPESATINGSATSQDTDAKDSETSSSQMEKGKTEDEIIRARCDEIKQRT
jgi:Kef-type K+ transport system membrane component KefB